MALGRFDEEGLIARTWERITDGIALFFAIPFQISLLLAGMALVFHDWTKLVYFGLTGALCAVGLYFFWYRNLKTEEQCAADDEKYGGRLEAMLAAAESEDD